MTIRPYRPTDLPEWLRMRLALWPDYHSDQASAEADGDLWQARTDAATFVAEEPDSPGLCGFVEVGERPYADGCESSPVAFLEAWYVDPDQRSRHIGAALVSAAESWAKSRGLTELASDALLENIPSHRAHLATGFEEVERSVKFRKAL